MSLDAVWRDLGPLLNGVEETRESSIAPSSLKQLHENMSRSSDHLLQWILRRGECVDYAIEALFQSKCVELDTCFVYTLASQINWLSIQNVANPFSTFVYTCTPAHGFKSIGSVWGFPPFLLNPLLGVMCTLHEKRFIGLQSIGEYQTSPLPTHSEGPPLAQPADETEGDFQGGKVMNKSFNFGIYYWLEVINVPWHSNTILCLNKLLKHILGSVKLKCTCQTRLRLN